VSLDCSPDGPRILSARLSLRRTGVVAEDPFKLLNLALLFVI
jgi:hypothetical protein